MKRNYAYQNYTYQNYTYQNYTYQNYTYRQPQYLPRTRRLQSHFSAPSAKIVSPSEPYGFRFTVKLRESEPKANDERLVSRMHSALSECKLKAQHELSAPLFRRILEMLPAASYRLRQIDAAGVAGCAGRFKRESKLKSVPGEFAC